METVMKFPCFKPEQGYDISTWGSPEKGMQSKQNVGEVSIFSANKTIFIAW